MTVRYSDLISVQAAACRLRSRRLREQAYEAPITGESSPVIYGVLMRLAEAELNTAVDLEALERRYKPG